MWTKLAQNRTTVLSVLTLGAVSAVTFWPLVRHPTDLLSGPQRFGLNDLSAFVLPRRDFTSRCVTTFGEVPFWNPYGGAGLPALGSGQWAFCYPPNWLYLLLPSPAVLSWLLVAHHGFAAVGALLLGRRYALSWPGALFSGVALLASPYVLAHTTEGHFMHVCAVAWTPWAFLAYERLRCGGRLGSVTVAATIGASFLAGHAQESYMLALILTACCAADIARAANRRVYREAIRLGGVWVLAGVATVGLVAVELVPNLVSLKLSVRSSGITADDAGNAAASVSWVNLGQLFNPLCLGGPESYTGPGSFFWETLCYFGVAPLILAVVAVIADWRRSPILRLAVIVLVALAFAFGPASVLFRLAYNFVPGLAWFRVPARSLFFAAFAVPMLAGAGLDAVVARCGQYVRIVGAGLIILVAAELGIFSAAVLRTIPPEALRSDSPLTTRLRAAPGPMRVLSGQDMLSDREAWSLGLHKVQAYEPVAPAAWAEFGAVLKNGDDAVLDFLQGFTTLPECRPNLLDLLCVRFIVLPKSAPESTGWRLVEQGEIVEPCVLRGRVPRTAKFYLYENPTVLPRAFVLGHTSVHPPGSDLRQALADLVPSDRVVVEQDVLPLGPRQDFRAAEIVAQTANRVEVRAELDAPGYLVLSDTWYPGWKATIDDQPAPVLRANMTFRAVPLAPGEHRVVFRFVPVGFALGACASAATVLLMALACSVSSANSRAVIESR